MLLFFVEEGRAPAWSTGGVLEALAQQDAIAALLGEPVKGRSAQLRPPVRVRSHRITAGYSKLYPLNPAIL
jgi:hypothetical protein